jgi:hypothetical protein
MFMDRTSRRAMMPEAEVTLRLAFWLLDQCGPDSHVDVERKGLQGTRRLFTTLNRYAKHVHKTEILALDEADAMAILTR